MTSTVEDDSSVLRPPVPTAIQGVKGYVHAFENGTGEVRHILLHECDVILECKVCKNLFRSLANFTSHKRFYCKVDYADVRLQIDPNPIVETPTEVIHTDEVINQTAEALSAEAEPAGVAGHTNITRKPLSSIADKLLQRAGGIATLGQSVFKPPVNPTESFAKIQQVIANRGAKASTTVTLEPVEGVRSAVFQTVNPASARLQSDWLAKHNNFVPAVLPNGRVASEFPENPLAPAKETLRTQKPEAEGRTELTKLSISSDAGSGDGAKINVGSFMDLVGGKPRCSQCSLIFSTELNLKDHIIVEHLDGRVRYMCPVCDKPFPAAPNLRKHLREIHQKNGTALDETLRKVVRKVHVNSETHRSPGSTPHKTQEPSTEKTSLGCSKCKRTFQRKDQLTSHEIFCVNNDKSCLRTIRERTLSTSSVGSSGTSDNNKNQVSSIQVRKDYSKKTIVVVPKTPEKSDAVVISTKAQALVQKLAKNTSCVVCEMKFSQGDSTTRHIASTHVNWNRYCCTICNVKRYEKYTIVRHINLSHSGLSEPADSHVRALTVAEQEEGLIEDPKPNSKTRASLDTSGKEAPQETQFKIEVRTKTLDISPPIVSVSESLPVKSEPKTDPTVQPNKRKLSLPVSGRVRTSSGFTSPPTSPTRMQNRLNRKNLSTDRKLFIVLPMPKKNREETKSENKVVTDLVSSRASTCSVESSPDSKASTSSIDNKENKAKSKGEPIIASVAEGKGLRKRKSSPVRVVPAKRK